MTYGKNQYSSVFFSKQFCHLIVPTCLICPIICLYVCIKRCSVYLYPPVVCRRADVLFAFSGVQCVLTILVKWR